MIELTVHGDPASCRRAAQSAGDAATAADEAGSRVAGIRGDASGWHGPAGEQFRARLGDATGDADELSGRIARVVRAIEAFAGELDAVQQRLAQARGIAAGAGLTVSGDTIHPPTAPAADSPAAVDAHNALVEAYNEAFGIAEAARGKEERAHATLTGDLAAADGDSWFGDLVEKLGYAPTDGADATQTALWGAGLANTAFGAAKDWAVSGRYGVFQPRTAGGQFSSTSGMSFMQRASAATRDSNWRASTGAAGTRGAWQTAGRVAKVGGLAITAATSAYGQWQEDADDPTLSTSERVGRTTTVAATTTAGAWAGAELGATGGAAIGTAICPGVGTVVGGLVGGAIGGFVGSEAGAWVGDQLKDAGGAIAEETTEFIEGAGDVASDVGDAVTFWD